ncbi:hypothetical protein LSH36_228g04007 [Paralvinella palmiformis]|uniref:Uncharacterized protein n=1 Tax=Paralvinella palmiformis TaxID=53620 RepID=A0AAD9N404_9ANNE|nr:hypothetical protein LSH36_228g04007 [Paralvinella palmiformis]
MSRSYFRRVSLLVLLLTAIDTSSEVNNSTEDTRKGEGPTPGRQNFTISEEKRLTQYLLWRYSVAGRGGRPVVNTSESTTVEFGLGLIQMALDEA